MVVGTELVLVVLVGFEVQAEVVELWCPLVVVVGAAVVVTTLEVVGWTGAGVGWLGTAMVTM